MPNEIQRRRVKGWRLPPGAIVVSRPTKWGNPFATAAEFEAAVEAVREGRWPIYWTKHQCLVMKRIVAEAGELRGHDLACWCKIGSPCHRTVLLRLANEEAA